MSARSWLVAPVMLAVISAPALALADGTVTVEPLKQKPFGPEKYISMTYEVKSPRDAASGQATGRRQHGAVCFVRAPSQSTPAWFSAVVNNEPLKSVTFDDGTTRFKLTTAVVANVKFFERDKIALEEICMTFYKIDITHIKSGATSSDTWMPSPV
jgi:type VI secretion system Hcp family effector